MVNGGIVVNSITALTCHSFVFTHLPCSSAYLQCTAVLQDKRTPCTGSGWLLRQGISTNCRSFRVCSSDLVWGPPQAAVWVYPPAPGRPSHTLMLWYWCLQDFFSAKQPCSQLLDIHTQQGVCGFICSKVNCSVFTVNKLLQVVQGGILLWQRPMLYWTSNLVGSCLFHSYAISILVTLHRKIRNS